MARSMLIVGTASTQGLRLDSAHRRVEADPDFADSILAELRPEGVAETIAADRAIRALAILRDGDSNDRAERSLIRALRALAALRSMRMPVESPASSAIDGDDAADPWRSRLVYDGSVSEASPVVRGTWITVGQVVSRIVDGWSWADLLRAHPELCEADIRACMAFATEDESGR